MIGTIDRAHARVDLAALANNVRRVAAAAGSARVAAVVKADAYGHGAVACSRVAVEAGATALAVHTVAEAEQLRMHGLTTPILVMGPLTGEEWVRAAEAGVEVVVWTPEAIYAATESGSPACTSSWTRAWGVWARARRTWRRWWMRRARAAPTWQGS